MLTSIDKVTNYRLYLSVLSQVFWTATIYLKGAMSDPILGDTKVLMTFEIKIPENKANLYQRKTVLLKRNFPSHNFHTFSLIN